MTFSCLKHLLFDTTILETKNDEKYLRYKAIDVANYVIGYTNELGKPVTNAKLQKILYFI